MEDDELGRIENLADIVRCADKLCSIALRLDASHIMVQHMVLNFYEAVRYFWQSVVMLGENQMQMKARYTRRLVVGVGTGCVLVFQICLHCMNTFERTKDLMQPKCWCESEYKLRFRCVICSESMACRLVSCPTATSFTRCCSPTTYRPSAVSRSFSAGTD